MQSYNYFSYYLKKTIFFKIDYLIVFEVYRLKKLFVIMNYLYHEFKLISK